MFQAVFQKNRGLNLVASNLEFSHEHGTDKFPLRDSVHSTRIDKRDRNTMPEEKDPERAFASRILSARSKL